MQDVGKPVRVYSQMIKAKNAIRHSLSVAGWGCDAAPDADQFLCMCPYSESASNFS